MFVPLHDENALKSIRFQYVTIGSSSSTWWSFCSRARPQEAAIAGFALVPAQFVSTGGMIDAGMLPFRGGGSGAVDAALVHVLPRRHPAPRRQHAVSVGVRRQRQDAMGQPSFSSSICLAVSRRACSRLYDAEPTDPLIGASGAVAGVIAAYLMLHPRVRVWVLALQFIPLRISAAFALGVWILIQFVMVMVPEIGPVAGGPISGDCWPAPSSWS